MTLPSKFCARMKDMLGAEYEAFYNEMSCGAPQSGLRINALKRGSHETVLSKLGSAEPVLWCSDGFYADKEILSGRHPYHAAGLFYFQEPSAMAAVPALGIKRGDVRVLDLCAAPGGKATQAAAELGGEGLLVANEIIPKRAKILSENIERMGVKNAVVTNEEPEKLLNKYPCFFDYIILDAPCSGEGMFRKEPQAAVEWSVEHSSACAVRQKHIADCAVGMLAAGGRLIYSTCTFAPAENEGAAAYILEKYPYMKLLDIEIDGLSGGCGEWAGAGEELDRTKRIFPHRSRGEGHFFALFEKDGGETCAAQEQKGVTCAAYEEFCRENLINPPDGILCEFGEQLYLLPRGINIDKIKVVRAGLHLGEVRKNRFIPSHALALALSAEDFKNTINYDAESDEIRRFLHGETLAADIDGWCAVLADGFPLGWAKGSQGILKNHYPKGLRI